MVMVIRTLDKTEFHMEFPDFNWIKNKYLTMIKDKDAIRNLECIKTVFKTMESKSPCYGIKLCIDRIRKSVKGVNKTCLTIETGGHYGRNEWYILSSNKKGLICTKKKYNSILTSMGKGQRRIVLNSLIDKNPWATPALFITS